MILRFRMGFVRFLDDDDVDDFDDVDDGMKGYLR